MKNNKENQRRVIIKPRLIAKYKKYLLTKEAFAVRFVKKYIKQANDKFLVQIIKLEAPKGYDFKQLQFKKVVVELFPRTIKPIYPKRSNCGDEKEYNNARNVIEWETSTRDIKQQHKYGIKGRRFIIEGELVKKRGKRPKMFIDSAPPEIKVLELDVKKERSHLWPEAMQYFNPDYLEYEEYKYKIVNVEEIKDRTRKKNERKKKRLKCV